MQYASILEEAARVRSKTGCSIWGIMGRIDVTGPRRRAFLDGLASFVAKSSEGAIRCGLVCDETGGPLDDLLLYKTDANHVFVVANASNKANVLARLEEHKGSSDVQIIDRSDELAMLALQGPGPRRRRSRWSRTSISPRSATTSSASPPSRASPTSA